MTRLGGVQKLGGFVSRISSEETLDIVVQSPVSSNTILLVKCCSGKKEVIKIFPIFPSLGCENIYLVYMSPTRTEYVGNA